MLASMNALKRLALVSGLIGLLAFLSLPFMPVNQVQSSFTWPQNHTLGSINAPLVSYAPEQLELTVPVAAIDHLRKDQSLIVGTIPPDSTNATNRGLFVSSEEGGLRVILRDKILVNLSAAEVNKLPTGAQVHIISTIDETTGTVGNHTFSAGHNEETNGDYRPQVSGVYTELDNTPVAAAALADTGLNLSVEINSRYTSSPTVAKYAAIWVGIIATIIALVCLVRMDRLATGEKPALFGPGFFRPRLLDLVVLSVLVFWYFLGANTSDDGFILTMARASEESTYMANYYRWFGVPESPFGAPYYDLLAQLAKVSTASIWMRLPSLAAGIVIWLTLSRAVLPRLGAGIDGRRVAHWTAALMFLAFWLPYNNGMRPEPIIAMGTLLAWSLFERSIATKRLAPAAVGTSVAAFTLACGPTGLMAVAALLVSLSGIFRVMFQRLSSFGIKPGSGAGPVAVGFAAMLAPFGAAGTAVLVAVFGDQTLMTVLESIHVRSDKGPSLQWYDEWVRYQVLFQQVVDGSFARRFCVLFTFVSIGFVLASMLRNGKVPGSRRNSSLRLLMVFLGTLFFMSFTPTKWSHHFGVWAGIAPAIAALAAVALSVFAIHSRRSRTIVIGGFLFVFAFALAGINGWWYTSSYGIPWFDKTIQINAIEASTVMMIIALITLVIGALQSFGSSLKDFEAQRQAGTLAKNDDTPVLAAKPQVGRYSGIVAAPIAVLCAISVLFSMASFAKAFASQYPAYTVGLGNLRSLTGNTCALAEDVLLETNTNDAFLTPATGILGESLENDDTFGFGPNNIPLDTTVGTDSQAYTGAGAANAVDEEEAAATSTTEDSVSTDQGTRAEQGINGSHATLPFQIDYHQVPVLGSFAPSGAAQIHAATTTEWYELPAPTEQAPILVVTAAGRIHHYDINGVEQDGQKLVFEFGERQANGTVHSLGERMMMDIGPAPQWRNLRFPLADAPKGANVVRIVASDDSLDPDQWLVFTPPRVPTMDSLNNVIGSETPGLLDWQVPLQFPCQRPFDHYAGVAEIPEYRISADYVGRVTGSPFQDYKGGGALGTAEVLNTSFELASYSKDDWMRDWGSILRYRLRTNSVGEVPAQAEITTETITRSGLWNPGHQNIQTS